MLIYVQKFKEEAAVHEAAQASAAEVAELPVHIASKPEHLRNDAVRKAGALLALPARMASKTERLRDDTLRKAGALLALPWRCLETLCLQGDLSLQQPSLVITHLIRLMRLAPRHNTPSFRCSANQFLGTAHG